MSTGDGSSIEELLQVMAALREPVTGCPWDLEQDFRSIAPYTIEEAYEVADAIARDDMLDLREELGDLLLQVVYHAQMAKEAGHFAFGDVVAGITQKMVRRHPHVFGDAGGRSAGAVRTAWEQIKAEEKRARAAERQRLGQPETRRSGLLTDVPLGLPGLTRAVKLQEKAARVGFDWPSLAPVLDKVKEEMAELDTELRALAPAETPGSTAGSGDWPRPTVAREPDDGARGLGRIEDELGDLLFVIANLARHLRVDPEAALRRANDKFLRRFAHIEARLAADGRTPAESSLPEMEAFWNEAKGMEPSR